MTDWIYRLTNQTKPLKGISPNTPFFQFTAGYGGFRTVENNILYTETSGNLFVNDISDPLNFILLGEYAMRDNTDVLFVDGNYAYAMEDGFGLRIIDVSNPANIFEVGSFATDGRLREIEDSFAYFSNSPNSIILDANDPSSPFIVYDDVKFFSSALVGMEIQGDYGYSFTNNEFISIDLTDKSNPVILDGARIQGSNLALGVSGNYACVVWLDELSDLAGYSLYDISDPSDIVLFSESEDLGVNYDFYNTNYHLASDDDYFYLIHENNEVYILDPD